MKPKRPTAVVQMRAVRSVVKELRALERDALFMGSEETSGAAARAAKKLEHAFSLSPSVTS